MAKTVKVLVAVVIDSNGYYARGDSALNKIEMMQEVRNIMDEGAAYYWLEADLPVPEIANVQAKVEKA